MEICGDLLDRIQLHIKGIRIDSLEESSETNDEKANENTSAAKARAQSASALRSQRGVVSVDSAITEKTTFERLIF